MEDKDKLDELRERLITQIGEVAENGITDPQQRYTLLMLRAKNSGDISLLNKAAEVVQSIEDPEEKTNALLELLEEIDFLIEQRNKSIGVVSDDNVRDGENNTQEEENNQ